MHSYQMILTVAEKAHSFYEASEAERIIDEIWRTIKGAYADLANAHFKSAQSAFAAVQNSIEPNHQVRIAIGHLTDAFNIYEVLLTKTKTNITLFFFREEIPVVSVEDSPQIKMCLFEIATCIAINYADVGELENGKMWKAKAMKYMSDYLNAKTAYLDGEYIYNNVNETFVEVITGRCTAHISGSGAVYQEDYTDYHLNGLGQSYIEQQKEEVRNVITNIYVAKHIL
jgi:hypothetical protein